MEDEKKIDTLTIKALRAIGGDRLSQWDDEKLMTIQLWGSTSPLESVEFVSFLLLLEEELGLLWGRPVRILHSKAFAESSNPFRTLVALKQYVLKLRDHE